MAIERTYYCEGPDCGGDGGLKGGATSVHARTSTPPPHLPSSFIEVRERESGVDYLHHFCGWDCLTKFAAAKPLPEIIEWGPDHPGYDEMGQ